MTKTEGNVKYTHEGGACTCLRLKGRDKREKANCICMCATGADRESRNLYMVMRVEEQRYNRSLVHRKCQTLNKNKVAGTAPITNSLNSCQTNTLQGSRGEQSRAEQRRGEERRGRVEWGRGEKD